MSVPVEYLYVGSITVCAGIGLLAFLILFASRMTVASRFPFRRETGEETRRCRYCLFGRATLYQEHSHVEDNDLVEVRCFVCCSCGLPHWSVAREQVLKKAA